MQPMQSVFSLFAVISAALVSAASAQEPVEVSFGTNWLAQGEHGGFYQALADGTYEEHGLDVTIVQGGPRTANRQLLMAGKLDFYMGGNLIQPFAAVQEGIPTVVVAAIFQKEPQMIMAHPGQGVESFEDLQELPTLFLSQTGQATFFQWMKQAYPGFSDEQVKPYAFSPAPFIADPRSAQQGYVTSEPLAVEREAGFEPVVFLLADNGFDSYSTTIETQRETVEQDPHLVRRFVEASIEGWYTYLYRDPSAADALIKQDNPDMTDEQLAYSREQMKAHGIVDSGVALEDGIGCIEPARVDGFHAAMVEAGVTGASVDPGEAYVADFVCQGHGLDLKDRLQAQ